MASGRVLPTGDGTFPLMSATPSLEPGSETPRRTFIPNARISVNLTNGTARTGVAHPGFSALGEDGASGVVGTESPTAETCRPLGPDLP